MTDRSIVGPSPAPQTIAGMRPGRCDCHAHVFGPYDRFPLMASRHSTPAEADKHAYLAMLDATGCDRGVLVQGPHHGWDNAAMVDALLTNAGRLRGVASVPPTISDVALAELDAAGVRGLRIAEIARLPPAIEGRTGLDAFDALLPRVRALGWHFQIWADCENFATHEARFRAAGVPLVVDHMGQFDVTKGVEDAGFQALLRLVRDGLGWVKLTAFRVSGRPPGFDNVRPFHDALLAANPDRLLWGSDWPFLSMVDRPDAGQLLSRLLDWLPGEDLRQRVLVANPGKLYGFT